MKIYFLSSTPCALTLNGVFYGITDTFERAAEIDLADGIYAQFSPEGALPIGFFITENITATPPKGCEVYLLKDGIALYAEDFPPSDFTLRPVAQKREGNILATLFRQGKLQLNIESEQGFFNTPVPSVFDGSELLFHNGYILLKSATHLGVFSAKAVPLLCERVEEYALTEEGVSALLPLSDRLSRKADCKWRFEGEERILTEFTLRQTGEGETPPEDLLAYAFFESALLKMDISPFLSEELQAEKTEILRFLGEFTAVILTENPKECGLVRKKKEGLFEVDYLSVEIENGKIVDVKG